MHKCFSHFCLKWLSRNCREKNKYARCTLWWIVHFTILLVRPNPAEFHEIWHTKSSYRRNHVCLILQFYHPQNCQTCTQWAWVHLLLVPIWVTGGDRKGILLKLLPPMRQWKSYLGRHDRVLQQDSQRREIRPWYPFWHPTNSVKA